jgi:hypothetical protein
MLGGASTMRRDWRQFMNQPQIKARKLPRMPAIGCGAAEPQVRNEAIVN